MTETLIGLKDLQLKLNALDARTGTRVLRRAANKAAVPVKRAMRARVPVGTEGHRTHKGRLVGPGFLKRSIRSQSRVFKTRGFVRVRIGVLSEAYYGISFLDQGPHRITKRRRGNRSKGGKRQRQTTTAVKPYTIYKRPWFESVFVANRAIMERGMVTTLRAEIQKAARGN